MSAVIEVTTCVNKVSYEIVFVVFALLGFLDEVSSKNAALCFWWSLCPRRGAHSFRATARLALSMSFGRAGLGLVGFGGGLV